MNFCYLINSTANRPDWDRCTALIDGDKWRNMINDKTSVQILETFVYELGGKKDAKNMTEYYTGLVYSTILFLHLFKSINRKLE